MARTAALFRQSDVARAIRAARAGGLEVTGVEIRQTPDGVAIVVRADAEKPLAQPQEVELNV